MRFFWIFSSTSKWSGGASGCGVAVSEVAMGFADVAVAGGVFGVYDGF